MFQGDCPNAVTIVLLQEVRTGNKFLKLDALGFEFQINSTRCQFIGCNRGVALQNLRRFDEALASHDQAIAFMPNDAQTYNDRGVTFQEAKLFGADVKRIRDQLSAPGNSPDDREHLYLRIPMISDRQSEIIGQRSDNCRTLIRDCRTVVGA